MVCGAGRSGTGQRLARAARMSILKWASFTMLARLMLESQGKGLPAPRLRRGARRRSALSA